MPRLPPADRDELAAWLTEVRPAGIERVEDLGCRPWSEPRPDFVLGVFRRGDRLAAWLLVGDAGTWAVASCIQGRVSAPHHSLPAALAALRQCLNRPGRNAGRWPPAEG